MGVGSLLFVHFALVEQVGPGQPGTYPLLDQWQPTQLTLGQPVHIVLVLS